MDVKKGFIVKLPFALDLCGLTDNDKTVEYRAKPCGWLNEKRLLCASDPTGKLPTFAVAIISFNKSVFCEKKRVWEWHLETERTFDLVKPFAISSKRYSSNFALSDEDLAKIEVIPDTAHIDEIDEIYNEFYGRI